MTPKEKAELLVDRFMPFASGGTLSRTEFVNAKHCAFISINERIEEAEWWHSTTSYYESSEYEAAEKRLLSLKQVKTEIENL